MQKTLKRPTPRFQSRREGTVDFFSMAVFVANGNLGAQFQVCRAAGFQTRWPYKDGLRADLEIGDTTGLETCATMRPRILRGGCDLPARHIGNLTAQMAGTTAPPQIIGQPRNQICR